MRSAPGRREENEERRDTFPPTRRATERLVVLEKG